MSGYSDYIQQKKEKIDYIMILIFLIEGKKQIDAIAPYADISYDEIKLHLEKIKNKDASINIHRKHDAINFIGQFLDFDLDKDFPFAGNDRTCLLANREMARKTVRKRYKSENPIPNQGLPHMGWHWSDIPSVIGTVSITKNYKNQIAFCRYSPYEYPMKLLKPDDISALAAVCADYILRLESLITDKQDLQKFIEDNMNFFNPIMESFRSYFLDNNGIELSYDELMKPFRYSPY